MTTTPPAAQEIVKPLECQAASVTFGTRAFIVLTLLTERVTFVFEWKPARGARHGAYVSRRVTPPMDPELAVRGLIFSHPEPDPLEVADMEIERVRSYLAHARADADRLKKQILGLTRRKKPSRNSKRPAKQTRKKA